MTTASDSPASDFPSELYQQSFSVPFAYPVCFTRRLFAAENPLFEATLVRLAPGRRLRLLVYVDAGVAAAHPHLVTTIKDYVHRRPQSLELVGSPEIVPGGEAVKQSWQAVRDVIWTVGNNHLDRQSFVAAVGGGSVLDMVGFAASLVHRGLRLVRVPTTVLAQCDAGVGVKNGMNEHGMKNFIGTFAPPFAVFNDSAFLPTLARRDLVGGIAEAFKVAIIKDASLLDYVCEHAGALASYDQSALQTVVHRTAILHLDHIRTSGDPFEFGAARPLDFGHWSAHKLEAMSGYTIGHGQAVAIGIAVDSFYAMRQGMISPADFDRIIGAMTEIGLPVWDELLENRTPEGIPVILDGLEEFREHLGGTLTVTLPDGLGRRREVHQMNPDVIEQALTYLKGRHAQIRGTHETSG